MSLSIKKQIQFNGRYYTIYHNERLVCSFSNWVSLSAVKAVKETLEKISISKKIRN